MTLTIPGYEVFESIGEGGMAEVYRGRHIRLDREVALKVMQNRMSKDPTFGDRFIREARIAAKLNHPHIVQIYDVNRFEGTFFLAMEYVKGGDLSLKLRDQLPAVELSRIVRDLCEALDYAHTQGYIHRDIKPGNVLFRENSSLALSDFGIARAIHSDTHMTQTGMVVGTPSYMSPEQAQGKPLTGSSDLYSVAVIAYQMVTGYLPYKSESSISVAIKHISEPVPKLPEHLTVLQGFFDKALAKDPNDRYENGKAMATEFSIELSKVKDLAWQNESDVETELIAAPLSNVTHSDFEAFTLERQDVSDLETELLSSEQETMVSPGAKVQHPPARQPAQKKPHDSALSGEVYREKQQDEKTAVQIVFMQINRIKVFMTHSQRGLIILTLALLPVIGMASYFIVSAVTSSKHQSLSPGQQIRVAQLLTKADENVAAGQLLNPLGNNAYEKYLAILAISPDDPVAVNGINNIATTLIEEVQSAIGKFDFKLAETSLNKLLEIKPDSDYIEDLNESLESAKENALEKVETTLSGAVAAESSGDIELAINQYNTVVNLSIQYGQPTQEVEQALRRIADEQIALANQNTQKEDFEKAKVSLTLAALAVSDIDGSGVSSSIDDSQQKLESAAANTVLRIKVAERLTLAKRALSQGKLILPNGDNAYDYYTSVLKLQSGNGAAKAGVEKILSELDKQATTQINREQFASAKVTIRQIKSRKPNDSRVARLNSELDRAENIKREREALAAKVKALYEKGDSYLARNRARSADKVYRRIEMLSPKEPGLQKLGSRIADSYAYLADREIKKRDWKDVYVWVDLGLRHVPNHRKLLDQKALADRKLKR